jgi:hypothetical protein
MARSPARSFQVLRHVLTSSRSAAILFVFLILGSLVLFSFPLGLFRGARLRCRPPHVSTGSGDFPRPLLHHAPSFACLVALLCTPCLDRFGGFSTSPPPSCPELCLFSGATLHPMFEPVRMSPPPSCPEIPSLVALGCTPCFDRLGNFPCPLVPHAPSLLVTRHYTILHYTPCFDRFRDSPLHHALS